MNHEQSDSYDLFISLLSRMVSSHLRQNVSKHTSRPNRKTRLVINHILALQSYMQDDYELTCELLKTTEFRRIA